MTRTLTRAAKGSPLTASDHDRNLLVLDHGPINVADFGCSPSNTDVQNKAGFDALADYLRMVDFNSTVHLYFPTGDYVVNGRILFTHCPNLIIHGQGSTIENRQGFGGGGTNYTLFIGRPMVWRRPGSRTTQYDTSWASTGTEQDRTDNMGPMETGKRVQTCKPGDLTLTFVTAGDSSDFAAGDRVILYSEDLTAAGFPRQFGKMEWRRIASVAAGSVTLETPIGMHHHQNQSDYEYDGAYVGAPRLINSEKIYYPKYIEVNDLFLKDKEGGGSGGTSDKGTVLACGDHVVYNNFGGHVLWPSMTGRHEINGGDWNYSEPDKFVGTVVMNNVDISRISDGGTSIHRFIMNNCTVGDLQAQRQHYFETNNCDIRFIDDSSTSYLRAYTGMANYGISGRHKDTRFYTSTNTFATLGFRNGLFLGGHNSNKAIFGSTFTPTGNPTTQITFSGTMAAIRDRVWPGRRVMCQKVGGGYTMAEVGEASLSGGTVTCSITCQDEILANGENYCCDWDVYAHENCRVLTPQASGVMGLMNQESVKYDGDMLEAVFRPDYYNTFVPELTFTAMVIEEMIVDVRSPYTGADATATFSLSTYSKGLGTSTAQETTAPVVDVKTAGTRIYRRGTDASITLSADSGTNRLPVAMFSNRLSWSITSLSERAGQGGADMSVMPDVRVTLKVRHVPASLYGFTS